MSDQDDAEDIALHIAEAHVATLQATGALPANSFVFLRVIDVWGIPELRVLWMTVDGPN